MAAGGSGNRSLEQTPSWALAAVCFVFIFLGIFVEYLIHLLGHWLKKHKKAALSEAIEKLKSVLMQLGFMSLILTVTQRWISKICIPNKAASSMLPCHIHTQSITGRALQHYLSNQFMDMMNVSSHHHRNLAASTSSNSLDHCASKGMSSLMSEGGINQLNIFIFILAAMHIFYSVATMGLGRAKMKRWKTWEKETQTVEYMAANDPERFRYTRQTTFGRRHVSTLTTNVVHLWIKCFFRQFFRSVVKVDYFTLRHGFISAHLSTNSFNFRKYIQRSLEDDFKAVVGISPIMWLLVVIFLLVDVHGWNIYLWVSFVPLIIVLVVGTKLEVIVARMAMQVANANETVIRGAPLVQPDNNLFWFKRPQLILTLLHFTLFMNAFEFSFFIWVTWQFGINSCYHEHVEIIVTRVVLAVMVQVVCSYITLPLYALVTQMGSEYKKAILEEDTLDAIKQWHANVKQKRRNITQDHSWSSTTNSPSPHRSTRPTLTDRPHADPEIVEEDIEADPNNY